MKRIAIGVGENENIIQACHIFKGKHPDTDIKLIYSDKDLVKAVLDKNIDGVVRGSLPASNIMKELKERYPNLSRATYVNGKEVEFLLTPVGIDEGTTIEEKFQIAMNCVDFLKRIKIGDLTLTGLDRGEVRQLNAREVDYLLNL